MVIFTVKDHDASTRLDVFLTKNLLQFSRSYIQKLCIQKLVRVNGQLEKTKYIVKIGDTVSVDINIEELSHHPDIKLDILYEDPDCMVINKPEGVLVHSSGAYNPEATVATFLAQYITDISGNRAGIVHRLDRATSGVMICAKTQSALSWLQKQFSQRKVKKSYYAVVQGSLDSKSALIDIPISRHPRNPKIFRTSSSGKVAQTEYAVIDSSPKHDLVLLKPYTGRTHQLRVHMQYLKHPIVGDTIYGGEPANRMYLHAYELELTLPNRTRKVFHVDVPESFQAILNRDEKINTH